MTATGTVEEDAAMQIDATVMTGNIDSIIGTARRMEEIGYDGLFTAETQHDPFLPLALAAE
ncbi:MAG TPA: hypothetical protein VHL53_11190, partial [Acidimicrobiia bacterium]|nr:hypothetical protein [Acidimicrobiia bacterium]